MLGLNRAYFIGHLGRNPERKDTKSGSALAVISLATPNVTKQDNGWIDTPDWHTLKAFGKTAESLLKNAHTGDTLAVECVVRPHKWTDREGNPRREVSFIVDRVLWIAKKRPAAESQAQHRAEPAEPAETEMIEAAEAGSEEAEAAAAPHESLQLGSPTLPGHLAGDREQESDLPF